MAQSAVELYRPNHNEPYMNDRQTEYFRRRLLTWQDELRRQLSAPLALISEEAARPADPLDMVVQEVNLQQDLQTLQRTRLMLHEVQAALERIEDGSYGYCLESGEEIGLQRLMVLPVATLSVEMQEQLELRRRNRRAIFSGSQRRG